MSFPTVWLFCTTVLVLIICSCLRWLFSSILSDISTVWSFLLLTILYYCLRYNTRNLLGWNYYYSWAGPCSSPVRTTSKKNQISAKYFLKKSNEKDLAFKSLAKTFWDHDSIVDSNPDSNVVSNITDDIDSNIDSR